MTVKGFFIGFAYAPSYVLSGLANIILGSTKLDPKSGEPVLDDKGDPVVNRGLVSLLFDAAQYIGRSVADLITANTTAITLAFWTSLVLSGAAALTVFLWPAALTAVTTFSIYGYSIAGVVGTDAMLQIGAVAALTFGATSVATYLTATVTNMVLGFIDLFRGPKKGDNPPPNTSRPEEEVEDVRHHSHRALLSGLHATPRTESPTKDVAPPAQYSSPLRSREEPNLAIPLATAEPTEHDEAVKPSEVAAP